jgi:hypothetical protein
VLGSVKAAIRALRSKELRQLLLQIPITERILSGAWRWLESLPEEKRERIRLRVGVPPQAPATRNRPFMRDEVTLATQSTRGFFRIDKARKRLDYTPHVPFARGIGLVKQWLRFANYL